MCNKCYTVKKKKRNLMNKQYWQQGGANDTVKYQNTGVL